MPCCGLHTFTVHASSRACTSHSEEPAVRVRHTLSGGSAFLAAAKPTGQSTRRTCWWAWMIWCASDTSPGPWTSTATARRPGALEAACDGKAHLRAGLLLAGSWPTCCTTRPALAQRACCLYSPCMANWQGRPHTTGAWTDKKQGCTYVMSVHLADNANALLI
jgi:hypothetical protein